MSFNFNPVNKNNAPAEQTPSHNNEAGMAKVSIRVDADCFLLCDGEFMGDIEIVANKITKVQLPIGQHLLEFMDKENPDIKMERETDFPEEGKSYLVLVDGLEEAISEAKEKKQMLEAARKAKEEAERKAKEEAERRAKVEAERKAKEEAERRAKAEAERKAKAEADRKAKEDAERKAKAEANRKAKEEAERKAKEEAERKTKEETEAERKDKKNKRNSIHLIATVVLVFIVVYFFKMCSGSDDNDFSNENGGNRIEQNFDAVGEYNEVATTSTSTIKIDPNLDIKKQLGLYYDYVYSLDSDGFYKVQKDNKYGLVTSDGTEVAAPVYDYIYSKDSETGFIKVQQNNLYGFLNSKGAEILKPQFDYIYSIDDDSGLMKVEKDDKYGFVNPKTMKLVTPCIYTYIYSLDGGLYKVEQGDKTGYLNKDGSVFKPVE